MKKSFLLMALGGLIVTSCANEETLSPANGQNANDGSAIRFMVNAGNQSRATDLETEYYDFGVWAYKATAETGINGEGALVMGNYLVGYTNGTTIGYIPSASQNLYGSVWYYEGLGSDTTKDHKYNFTAGPVQANPATSVNDVQYLKYWDLTSGLKTYFYAGAPYGAATGFDPATRTLTFGQMSMSIAATDVNDSQSVTNFMYAANSKVNADMVGEKVDLSFKRLGAKLRLGFYETIPGYKVEIIGYSASAPYVYAVPALPGTPDYTAGSYVCKGTPSIVFSDNVGTVTWSDTETTSDPIICPLWFSKDGGVTHTNIMGVNNSTDLLLSDYKGILPGTNVGFTLNISFKLIAEDTDEVIYVRGARVHVAAEYVNWVANTAYTYIFKITTAVPGQPTDPGTPSPTPTPDPYLWPIIFDQVQIEDLTTTTVTPEFNIN